MNVSEKLKFMDPRFDTPTQCLHQGWSNRLLRQGWIFKEKIPRLSVNVEDVLFWSEIFLKTKKKSSSVQCRDPFPILYSGGSVRSLSQLGSDILISFIYLSLSYGKQLKLSSSHIASSQSTVTVRICNELCNKPPSWVLRKRDHP